MKGTAENQEAKLRTTLLSKGIAFEWSSECHTTFEKIYRKLTDALVLQYPDVDKPFILTTDANQFAIESISSQGISGQDRHLTYASRILNKANKYSTSEKEMLSIVWSVKNFRSYLLGQEF